MEVPADLQGRMGAGQLDRLAGPRLAHHEAGGIERPVHMAVDDRPVDFGRQAQIVRDKHHLL